MNPVPRRIMAKPDRLAIDENRQEKHKRNDKNTKLQNLTKKHETLQS